MYEKGYEMFSVNILSAVLKVQDPQKKLYIHSECSKGLGHGMPQPDAKYEMLKLTSHLLMDWSIGFKELGQRSKAV